MPECKLWFLHSKDDEGKTFSNPNISYDCSPYNMLREKRESFIKFVKGQPYEMGGFTFKPQWVKVKGKCCSYFHRHPCRSRNLLWTKCAAFGYTP